MMSVSPEARYPVEPFEWGLPAVQIWYFQLLNDWKYIDLQTGHFADFDQFTIACNFAVFRQV